MSKVKVGVAGYGVIGQRLADGAALQGDMEVMGVVDVYCRTSHFLWRDTRHILAWGWHLSHGKAFFL